MNKRHSKKTRKFKPKKTRISKRFRGGYRGNYAYRGLNELPNLEEGMTELRCQGNNLSALPNLPNSLVTIMCSENKLTTLPQLPNHLEILYCGNNQLTTLPELPNSLLDFTCQDNKITLLPNLPINLSRLDCAGNLLTQLPQIPNSLRIINCSDNPLTRLPNLPDELEVLLCSNIRLAELQTLPRNIIYLDVASNNITKLPNDIPQNLVRLNCANNPLTSLPKITSVIELILSFDQVDLLTVDFIYSSLRFDPMLRAYGRRRPIEIRVIDIDNRKSVDIDTLISYRRKWRQVEDDDLGEIIVSFETPVADKRFEEYVVWTRTTTNLEHIPKERRVLPQLPEEIFKKIGSYHLGGRRRKRRRTRKH